MSTILPRTPWRVLLFDPSDPDDPRWLMASVTLPTDVRPADVDDQEHRYTDWPAVLAWLRQQTGRAVTLTPINRALAWRIDEKPGERADQEGGSHGDHS